MVRRIGTDAVCGVRSAVVGAERSCRSRKPQGSSPEILATVCWVGFAAVIGVVAATLVGTVLMSAAFLIYHAVWRRAKRPLAYTVLVTAWLAYEYIYLHNDQISFPWLVLGNGFAQDVRLVQWYEYTGALGGSLWVLVVNLLVFEASKRWRQWRSWIAPVGAIVLPAVLSWIIYATYKEPSEKIEISVVQPNFDTLTLIHI